MKIEEVVLMKVYEDVFCGVCDYCGRPIVDKHRIAIDDFYVVGNDAVCSKCYEKSVAEFVIDGIFYGYMCWDGLTYAECIKSGFYNECMEVKKKLGEEPVCESKKNSKIVRKFKKGQKVNEPWAFPKLVFVCDDPDKYGTMEFIEAIVKYRKKKEEEKD